MQIPQRIEQQRVAAGLSETQLATMSAIPRMTLKRRMVDPSTFKMSELERVAAALDVTVLWLIQDAA